METPRRQLQRLSQGLVLMLAWACSCSAIAAAQPDAVPLTVSGTVVDGRVVDEQGDAIVGVQVHCLQLSGAFGLVSAKSDATGHFELVGLESAEHQLTFAAQGFRPQKRKIQVLPDDGIEPIEVVLVRSATVSGQVSWPDGRPASEIDVMVRLAADGPRVTSSDSDSNGYFEINNAPIGPAVVVAKVGSVASREEIEIRLGRNLVSLTLPPGVEVSGWVIDASGEPVSSAHVILQPPVRGRKNSRVFSGDDGSFILTDVVPGRYWLDVRHPQYATSMAASRFEVVAEPIGSLEARLRRGAVVTGRLEGLGLEDWSEVEVSLLKVKGRRTILTVAPDHVGRFRFEHVLPSPYQAEAKLTGRVLAAGELVVSAGEEEIETELLPLGGVDVRGRVLHGDRGVADARLRVTSGRPTSARTAEDGTFVLKGVNEGRQQLSVRGNFGRIHQRQIEVREGQEVVVELPTGEISGRVRDVASGEPLAGVAIDLLALEDPGSPAENWPGISYQDTTSDAFGVFVLRVVDSGRYRLNVQHDGYEWAMADLEVGSAPLRGVDIDLNPSGGMVLRVSRDDGSPIQRVDVALFDQAGRRVLLTQQKVGADGKAHIASVPAGIWQLFVRSSNSTWSRLNVRVSDEEIPVVLAEGASVIFRAPDLGNGPTNVVIDLRDTEGRTLPEWAAGGKAAMSSGDTGLVGHLWPGQWTLEMRHPDGRTWRADFIARAGERSEIELR